MYRKKGEIKNTETKILKQSASSPCQLQQKGGRADLYRLNLSSPGVGNGY